MKAILWKKTFRKDHKKLTRRELDAWTAALVLLKVSPFHPSLRRHKVKGQYEGLESIDILPDLRALFLETQGAFVFYYIRNHNQLYG